MRRRCGGGLHSILACVLYFVQRSAAPIHLAYFYWVGLGVLSRVRWRFGPHGSSPHYRAVLTRTAKGRVSSGLRLSIPAPRTRHIDFIGPRAVAVYSVSDSAVLCVFTPARSGSIAQDDLALPIERMGPRICLSVHPVLVVTSRPVCTFTAYAELGHGAAI